MSFNFQYPLLITLKSKEKKGKVVLFTNCVPSWNQNLAVNH